MPILVPSAVRATAAGLFGVDPAGLIELDRGGAPDGAVFACTRDDVDAFLKLKPATPATLRTERDRIGVVAHLRDHVRVLEYLPSGRGELVEAVGDDEVFSVTLTVRAQGRHVQIPEDWTAEFITAWGRTLGRMHAALHGYRGGPNLPDWREEHRHFGEGCQDEEVGEVWRELGEAMDRLPVDDDVFGVVHNDLHTQNLLIGDDGGLTVLDFDVCARHWFATDLAIVLAHPIWELRERAPDAVQPLIDTVIEAYLAAYPAGVRSLPAVPLLMRYRLALFVLAMTAENGGHLPGWMQGMRAWVVSGEPLTDAQL